VFGLIGTSENPLTRGRFVQNMAWVGVKQTIDEPCIKEGGLIACGQKGNVVEHTANLHRVGDGLIALSRRAKIGGKFAAAKIRPLEALPLFDAPIQHGYILLRIIGSSGVAARIKNLRISVDPVGDIAQQCGIARRSIRAVAPLRQ